MRNLFKLLFVSVLIPLFGSCSDSVSPTHGLGVTEVDLSVPENREFYGLNGSVKDVTEITTEKKKTIRTINHTFDSNGRLLKSVQELPNQDPSYISFGYDAFGRIDIGSDKHYRSSYNDDGKLVRVEYRNEGEEKNDIPDLVWTFEYDNEGRLIEMMIMDGPVEKYGGCPNYGKSIEYSPDGRLTKVTVTSGMDVNEFYYSPEGPLNIERQSFSDEEENHEETTYTIIETDSLGNWVKAEAKIKKNRRKPITQQIERQIVYYDEASLSDVNPTLTLLKSDSAGGVEIPFTAKWFDNLKIRYTLFSIETSAKSSGLLITALILTILGFALGFWYLWAIGTFEDFTGEIQSNGMKRLWMYNHQPYLQVLYVSLLVMVAFLAAITVLFIFGGIAWGLMGLVWLILKVLIFVGYASAIIGGLALLGKEGVGCLPLIIGIVIICWKDDINRWANSALEWGQGTFSTLNIFDWGWKLIVDFWDVILIVALTPLALFLAFALIVIILDGLLMGIEWIITRIYSVRRPCPSCGSTHTPEYIIGGKPHPVRLAPGIYGTFTQKSPVTGEMLPTMLMNGRGKLRRRCQDCGQYMDSNQASRSFGTEMHIGLVGPRSSGKSYLVYSALKQLMDDFPERIEQIDKDPETDISLKADRIDNHGGIQTRLSNRYRGIQLIVKSKMRPVPHHLFFYDVAGEKFNASSQASRTAMEFYRNVESIIFIVDPFMIDYSRLPASERMISWDRTNAASMEKNDLTSTFEMMCRILEEQGRSMSKIDFTFAVVKTDGGYLSALGLPDHGNTPEVIEALMTNDLGLRNIIDGARARFRNVSFGSTAVYGEGRDDMRQLFREVLKRLGLSL